MKTMASACSIMHRMRSIISLATGSRGQLSPCCGYAHRIICIQHFQRASYSSSSKDRTHAQANIKELLDSASTTLGTEKVDFPSDIVREHIIQNNKKRKQENQAFRPKIDARETNIFLFPGQGSQFVGMGKQLLCYDRVPKMYEVASDILGYDLLDVCLNGPKSKLDRTVYCQPAILVSSLAAVERLREENPTAIENCISAAGFSVGEYAALVFAGALSFEDAVEVIRVRANAMQAASEVTPSGMMTCILSPDSKLAEACNVAKQYCREELDIHDPVCQVANYLYTQCKVIAGNLEALEFVKEHSRQFSLRKLKFLPVSGAFHTSLMQPSVHRLRKVLDTVKFEKPIIPVHSNVDSKRYTRPDKMARMLVEQVYRPVKWEQIVHALYSRNQGEGFPFTYELGPGRQLGTLLKMTNEKAFQQYRCVEV